MPISTPGATEGKLPLLELDEEDEELDDELDEEELVLPELELLLPPQATRPPTAEITSQVFSAFIRTTPQELTVFWVLS